MKKNRVTFLVILSVVLGVLLSSCAGGPVYNTWPGLSAGEDVIYLATRNSVYAVKDGTLVWQFPSEPDNAKAFYAPPVVTEDQIIAGDYTNSVYGINPENGSQVWALPKESGHVVGRPQVVEDTVLVPSSDHNLYALDTQGTQKWAFRTGNILWAQPISDGEVVYQAGMDHFLYALNLSDGSLVWKKDLGSPLPGSPAVGEDGTLYLITLGGKVLAVNPEQQGEVLWEALLGGEIWSTPLLHEGVLYIGSSNGKVYAVSTEAAGQRVTWEVDLGSPVIGGGALFEDKVVFATEENGVAAISFDGQKLWNPSVNGKLYTTPVVDGDEVVVASMGSDKILTAFDANGTEKWSYTLP